MRAIPTVKNLIRLSNLDIDSSEAKVLLELSPEISNFRPGFKGDFRKTFILTPYGSAMFGFDIIKGVPILGVPTKLYDLFQDISFDGVYIQPGKPGIYLSFCVKRKNKKDDKIAVRIFLRKRRVAALNNYKKIRILGIDNAGVVMEEIDPFDIALRNQDCFIWED